MHSTSSLPSTNTCLCFASRLSASSCPWSFKLASQSPILWSQLLPPTSPLPSSACLNSHWHLLSMHWNTCCKELVPRNSTSVLVWTTLTSACRNNFAHPKNLRQAAVEELSIRGKDYTYITHWPRHTQYSSRGHGWGGCHIHHVWWMSPTWATVWADNTSEVLAVCETFDHVYISLLRTQWWVDIIVQITQWHILCVQSNFARMWERIITPLNAS